MKKALITGITGQDGSYLAELLLDKGYKVFGFVRRSSTNSLERLAPLLSRKNLKIFSGNMRDLNVIRRVMEEIVPDEVYNLAAQSHVGISFDCPEETWEVNYYGVGRIVNEALLVNPNVKIYQASTSEMFGKADSPQNEDVPFDPISPYAEAKLRAHEDFIVGYRKNHKAFTCAGILFNHESPRRGNQFVTKKITSSLAKIKLGIIDSFELGNMDSRRDWGFAGDYVEAMWMMLQQEIPCDFVIGMGKSYSVRDFVNAAAKALDMKIIWEGEGKNEVCKNEDGNVIIRVSEKFYRPTDPHDLIADATKAKKILGWVPKTSFEELVEKMVTSDLELQKEKII
jgi:GDPmannose 4,6-dehydratase